MKYTGELQKTIPTKKIGLLDDEDSRRAEAKRIAALKVSKMPALFAAHGVALGDWVNLAFELAKEFVPGFRVVEPAGRPTEWSGVDKAEFKLSVDDMQAANPGIPKTQAITKVCRLSRWEAKTKGMKVTALRKHYDNADATWVAIVKDAKAYESMVRED